MDENHIIVLFDNLRRKGSELEKVEVKEARNKVPSKLIRSICAFANSEGGTVILGV